MFSLVEFLVLILPSRNYFPFVTQDVTRRDGWRGRGGEMGGEWRDSVTVCAPRSVMMTPPPPPQRLAVSSCVLINYIVLGWSSSGLKRRRWVEVEKGEGWGGRGGGDRRKFVLSSHLKRERGGGRGRWGKEPLDAVTQAYTHTHTHIYWHRKPLRRPTEQRASSFVLGRARAQSRCQVRVLFFSTRFIFWDPPAVKRCNRIQIW